MKKQLFIVQTVFDGRPINLFIAEEEYCKKYVARFNSILKHFKNRNEKMEDEFGGIAFDYVIDFSDSFYRIKEQGEAYYKLIEFRK